jgi:hypothetical protein
MTQVAGQPTHRLTLAGEAFNDGLAVLVERVQAFLDGVLVVVNSPRRLCSVKQTFRHCVWANVEVQYYTTLSNLGAKQMKA